jgi:hypothetical protein
MAAAYAVLIAYSNQRTPDGQRRKLPRVELDKPVDLGEMWAEMKDFGRGTLWRGDQQQQQQRPSPGSAGNDISSTGNNNNALRGMDENADRRRK